VYLDQFSLFLHYDKEEMKLQHSTVIY